MSAEQPVTTVPAASSPDASATARPTGRPDAEAIACALGVLVDSLLVHLRERRLLEDEEIDDIYETAIRAHRSREDDGLSARIVAVLTRMQSDGTAFRRQR